MKFRFLLFIILFASGKIFCAQNKVQHQIDSLKSIISSKVHDTVKFATYSSIAQIYWSINPNDGIPYAQKGLELAIKLNKKKYLTQAYGILGMNYELIADHANGIKNLTKSLDIAKEINDHAKIGLAAGALGNVYYFQSNFPQAIDYYITSLKASERSGNKREIAAALSNIGAIYFDLKEGDKALPYFEKALKINQEIGFKVYQAINLSNIGNIYDQKNNFQSAMDCFLQGLKINQEINDIPGIAGSYNSIGACYYNLNKLDSAYDFINKSIAINRQVQNLDELAHSYKLLANIYYDAFDKNITSFLNQYCNNSKTLCLKLASAYADSSITFNTKIENLDRLSKAYNIHSKIQLAMGNCATSLESFKKFKELNDSVYNIDVNNKLTQKTMQFEFDKKEATLNAEQEKKDAITKAEKEKSAQQKVVLFIGLIAAVSFAAWDYRQKKIISKQKKEVELQKEIVEFQNEEILASITYAKRIQSTILPPQKIVKSYLQNSFILYLPKDIVAGDFYWMESFQRPGNTKQLNNQIVLFAACDCTGHGVPGALVSVVCCNALNRVVNEYKIIEPAKILDKVTDLVVADFSKDENENVQDGMDISIVALNKEEMYLEWAGANNPLWIIRKGVLIEFKADKQPIGKNEDKKPFTNHRISLEADDHIYLFTDGFSDQFGGKRNKKLTKAKFKEVLISAQNLSIEDQKNYLSDFIVDFRGNQEQVDDILVMGVRI